MYFSFGSLLVLFAVVSSQNFHPPPGNPPRPGPNQNALACGFSCTRQASFTVFIDGQQTTARCTDQNTDPGVRCSGCCHARALAAGLETTNAAGFASTNNRDCICCINNPCRGF